jgi:hypothetical protein
MKWTRGKHFGPTEKRARGPGSLYRNGALSLSLCHWPVGPPRQHEVIFFPGSRRRPITPPHQFPLLPVRFDPSLCLYKDLPLLSIFPFFPLQIVPPGRPDSSPEFAIAAGKNSEIRWDQATPHPLTGLNLLPSPWRVGWRPRFSLSRRFAMPRSNTEPPTIFSCHHSPLQEVHEPVDHEIDLAEIFLTSYTSPASPEITGALPTCDLWPPPHRRWPEI